MIDECSVGRPDRGRIAKDTQAKSHHALARAKLLADVDRPSEKSCKLCGSVPLPQRSTAIKKSALKYIINSAANSLTTSAEKQVSLGNKPF